MRVPEPVTVRVCSAADASQLGPDFADRWAGQLAGRWSILTAWSQGDLVGVGMLRWEGPFNPTVAAALPGQVEVGFLQVEPGWRDQGIGTALLELACRLCHARAVPSLGLGVGIDNARALALYRRLGFTDTGLRFTDTYQAVDPQGRTYEATEAGTYLTRDLVERDT